MASPVDTSVKFFHSGMTGAPVLNRTAGVMIALLDACLKDGFDLKAATTLVVSGGVATLAFSGTHSAEVHSVILVDGSSIAALNGEQKITAKGVNTLSFATAAGDGTATGTITFKMAPLGWQKPFSGTNLAAYRSPHLGASGFYVRVDDTGVQDARVHAFATMVDINNGTGRFPTNTQQAGGLYWPKAYQAAGSSAIPWILVGDGLVFYICVSAGFSQQPTYVAGGLHGFGDMIPYRDAGDPWTCTLGGMVTSATASNPHSGSFAGGLDTGQYSARNYTGLSESWPSTTRPFVGNPTVLSGLDPYLGPFPSRVDGSLRLSRRFVRSADNSQLEPRCEVPGILHVPQTDVYEQIPRLTTQVGTGVLANRSLMSVAVHTTYTQGSGHGAAFVDITGPWR